MIRQLLIRWFPQWFVTGGAVKDKFSPKDYTYEVKEKITGSSYTRIDNSHLYPEIENQGRMNNCTNQAMSDIMWMLAKQNFISKHPNNESYRPDKFSRFYNWNKVRIKEGKWGKNEGVKSRDTIDSIRKDGLILKRLFKESMHTKPTNLQNLSAKYYTLGDFYYMRTKRPESVKDALDKTYGVYVAMVITNDIIKALYKTVKETDKGNTKKFGHAMIIVGYDGAKQAFKIRNSWGKSWGYKGYFWLDYTYFNKLVYDIYVMKLNR